MEFCESCGSVMHPEGEVWACRACDHETPREADEDASMAVQDGQQDDGTPDVADATQEATETTQEPCPAADCESDRANYEMMPKPGGAYEVRLFTCVECGHTWRGS